MHSKQVQPNSQWQAVDGWQGGAVTALACSPHVATDRVILAGTLAGLFLSTDGGTNWRRAGHGMADFQVTALAATATPSGVVALAATQSGHLYRTKWDATPQHLVWQPLSWAGLGVVQALAFSPAYAQDQTLFTATSDGIFRTQDDGATWESSTFGLLDLDILCLACALDFAESEVLWAGSAEGGLYRSRNGARSWRDSGVGLPDSAILALLVSPNYMDDQTLYAATDDNGIYRSTDGSATWQPFAPVLAGVGVNALTCSADQQQWVVASTDGLLVSHDGGATWSTAQDTTVNSDPAIALTVALADDLVLAGTLLDGLLASTDGGVLWVPANRGLIAHAAPFTQLTPSQELVALDVAGLLACYAADGGGWSTLNHAFNDAGVTALAATTAPRRPLAVATEQELLFSLGDLDKTREGAVDQWYAVPLPEEDVTLTLIAPSPAIGEDQTLFVGENSGRLWQSTAWGERWQPLTPPWQDVLLLQLACSPFYLRDHLLYAVTATQPDPAEPTILTVWQGREAGAVWEALADLQSDSAAVALHLPQDPVTQPILLATRNRLIKLSRPDAPSDPIAQNKAEAAAQWQITQHFLPEEVRITGIVTTPLYVEEYNVFLTTTQGIYEGCDDGNVNAGEWQQPWPEIADQAMVGLHCTENGQPLYAIGVGGMIWQASIVSQKKIGGMSTSETEG
ncbi:MAG TPA: hypothetical protein P5121_04330 [Caldilineaceae bacterium]|nr:hypothetical protein [Caldilineaceae bacterium]